MLRNAKVKTYLEVLLIVMVKPEKTWGKYYI